MEAGKLLNTHNENPSLNFDKLEKLVEGGISAIHLNNLNLYLPRNNLVPNGAIQKAHLEGS